MLFCTYISLKVLNFLHVIYNATEKAIPTLFRRYMQVSADHARKYGGTGLGLAICKQLVITNFYV